MKRTSWLVLMMYCLGFSSLSLAADEAQTQGTQKDTKQQEAKQPTEEGKAAADKDSGESKKKKGEKKEGGGEEPGCD